MNMMTSKPQNGAIPLNEALVIANGDVEAIRNSRLIARNGKPYISRRLLEIRLAEKQRLKSMSEEPTVQKQPGLLARFVRWLWRS